MDLNMATRSVLKSSLYILEYFYYYENIRLLLIKGENEIRRKRKKRIDYKHVIYRENKFKYSSRVFPGPMPV